MRCRRSLAVSAVSSCVPVWVDHGSTNALSPHRPHRADFHAAGSSDTIPRTLPRMRDPRSQQGMVTSRVYLAHVIAFPRVRRLSHFRQILQTAR